MVLATRRFASTLTLVVGAACSPAAEDRVGGAATDSAHAPARSIECYHAGESVLARQPGTVAEGPPGLTGWIRFDPGSSADSGAARLIDSDGRSLGATWRRSSPDSVTITGFDDFLRVEMRLARSDSVVSGAARAHSDAALERDSTGKQVEFRREWTVTARRTSCDGIP
jgi:hypothetical protein